MTTAKSFRPNPTEHLDQKKIIQWADLIGINRWPQFKLPYPGDRGPHDPEFIFPIFAVPNGSARPTLTRGGRRVPVVAQKLKAEGVRPGVPDLWLPVRSNGWPGLIIELKRLKGGRLSMGQSIWLEFLAAQGYKTAVCKGADAGILQITDYLENNR